MGNVKIIVALRAILINKFKFDEVNVMNELVFRNLSEDAKRQICA